VSPVGGDLASNAAKMEKKGLERTPRIDQRVQMKADTGTACQRMEMGCFHEFDRCLFRASAAENNTVPRLRDGEGGFAVIIMGSMAGRSFSGALDLVSGSNPEAGL